MTDTRTPVVFIHRLWLHTASWAPWLDLLRTSGYERLPLAALRSTLPVFKNPANKHKVV